MDILVCIKQVPASNKVEVDPVTGVLLRNGADSKMNPYDLYALETALKIREEVGGTISVISMGPPQAMTVIREAFAMGVDRGALLSDRRFGGADVLATSYTIAQGIKKMDDVRDTVTVNSILTTSDQAYSKTDLNSDTLEKEDGDEEGPFDLGVSITETLDDDKETQIVYYSSSNLMESQVNQMVSGGNEKLIIESLKWMTDTGDSATVSIPSKSLSVSYLTLTDYDAAFWKICTIGLIPGFFLVVGFVVWMKRRKA